MISQVNDAWKTNKDAEKGEFNLILMSEIPSKENNSFPLITECRTRWCLVGVMHKPLTCHRRGWLQEWHGCCPCLQENVPGHRKSAGCSVQRTSVSPGWCPGGPASPHTERWCDRLPADSSLDPCSQPGHLTRSYKSHTNTLSLNNSLDTCLAKETKHSVYISYSLGHC